MSGDYTHPVVLYGATMNTHTHPSGVTRATLWSLYANASLEGSHGVIGGLLPHGTSMQWSHYRATSWKYYHAVSGVTKRATSWNYYAYYVSQW